MPDNNDREPDDTATEESDQLGTVEDDDMLFDPMLSDEPIDLAAVRADDALLDALSGTPGVAVAKVSDLVDPEDDLIMLLAAWAASTRPLSEVSTTDMPEQRRETFYVVRVTEPEADTEPLPVIQIVTRDASRQARFIRRMLGRDLRRWALLILRRLYARLLRRR